MTERTIVVNLDSEIGNTFYQLLCVMEKAHPDDFSIMENVKFDSKILMEANFAFFSRSGAWTYPFVTSGEC